MGIMEERSVYTVSQVTALTGFSRQTISRIFVREKGVLILKRPERVRKRPYRSISIPRAVCDRVIKRLSC